MILCFKNYYLLISHLLETIYAEPSLPSPVYQEINAERTSANNIEMMANNCYQITGRK